MIGNELEIRFHNEVCATSTRRYRVTVLTRSTERSLVQDYVVCFLTTKLDYLIVGD